MVGDIRIRLGGAALTARVEYQGVLARGLSRLWPQIGRSTSHSRATADIFSVSETLEKVTVIFEVPGYERDELLLEVTPRSVRLRNHEPSTEARIGRAVDRIVPLPETVEPDRALARLQDGLLTVELPTAAWVQGRARGVSINTGSSAATAQENGEPEDQA